MTPQTRALIEAAKDVLKNRSSLKARMALSEAIAAAKKEEKIIARNSRPDVAISSAKAAEEGVETNPKV